MVVFCTKCNNIVRKKLLTINEKELLHHVCAYCNVSKKITERKPHIVHKKYYIRDHIRKTIIHNHDIVHDNTLPRLRNMQCINPSCPTKGAGISLYEIKYIDHKDFISKHPEITFFL